MTIGERSMFEGGVIFEKNEAQVSIGSGSFIGNSLLLSAMQIDVGQNVLIAFGCTIADHDSHSLDFTQRSRDVELWYEGKKDWSVVKMAPVKICDRAWIGMNSIILKGVTVGEGAVVGAGSVVTKDVAPYTLVAGNPARLVRELKRPQE